MAEDVKGRIVNEIESAGMYSVMADTSPDTANTDRLVVAVRRGGATGGVWGEGVEHPPLVSQSANCYLSRQNWIG
jgi:hypothetical protein